MQIIQNTEVLDELFELKYGSLADSPILTKEEYMEWKKWCITSGFFSFCLLGHPKIHNTEEQN